MLTSFLRHVLISNVIIDYLVARRTFFFFVSRASKEALGELKGINFRERTNALSPRFDRGFPARLKQAY